LLDTRIEYVATDQMPALCGAAKVALNPRLSPAEISFILSDSAELRSLRTTVPGAVQVAVAGLPHRVRRDRQESPPEQGRVMHDGDGGGRTVIGATRHE
jgi:hypothetical protein